MKNHSKENARRVFWALGENSWKQVIDGEFQPYGPLVFDLGLHGGGRETGFYDSLTQGLKFAGSHLTEPLTPQLYLECHRLLCQHFKGAANNTMMLASEAGEYRNTGYSTLVSLKADLSDTAIQHYFFHELYDSAISSNSTNNAAEKSRIYQNRANFWLDCFLRDNPMRMHWVTNMRNVVARHPNLNEVFESNHKPAEIWVKGWRNQWEDKVQQLNNNMAVIADKLRCPPFASFYYGKDQIVINHLINDSNTLESIHKKIVQHYHRRMLNEGSQGDTFRCHIIAEHFQLMKWLHPLKDGQTRLDLVILAKLLSEEGLSPTILSKAHASLTMLPAEWTKELEKGMERWQTVAQPTVSHMKAKL